MKLADLYVLYRKVRNKRKQYRALEPMNEIRLLDVVKWEEDGMEFAMSAWVQRLK